MGFHIEVFRDACCTDGDVRRAMSSAEGAHHRYTGDKALHQMKRKKNSDGGDGSGGGVLISIIKYVSFTIHHQSFGHSQWQPP